MLKNLKSIDLILIIILSLLLIPVTIFDFTTIKVLIGLLFILFFPGYVLAVLIFPRKNDLRIIGRISLSFGLSIALVPLVGLILNSIWEIDPYSILISLEILTIGLASVALYRRKKISEEDRFSIKMSLLLLKWQNYRKSEKFLIIILLFFILASLGLIIYRIITPKVGEKYTEFYVLGGEGKTSDYPFAITPSQDGKVIIGVANHESEKKAYRIEIIMRKKSILSKTIILENVPFEAEKKWAKQFEIPLNFSIAHPSDYKMEFLLFMADNVSELETIDPLNTKPYRNLRLVVRDFALFDEEGNVLKNFEINKKINLTASCDFVRKILAPGYKEDKRMEYTLIAKQGDSTLAKIPFFTKKIDKNFATLTINNSEFSLSLDTKIQFSISPISQKPIEFFILENGEIFRTLKWEREKRQE